MLATALFTASAAIIFVLGSLHLFFTFSGPKFLPRDAALQARMAEVSPVITRQTTMWKAWIGFNASHSQGALLFGAVYAYLALWQGPLLVHSPFLLGLGGAFLAGYLFLGWRYWFSVPFRGTVAATALYAGALLAGLAAP